MSAGYGGPRTKRSAYYIIYFYSYLYCDLLAVTRCRRPRRITRAPLFSQTAEDKWT